MLCLHCHKEKPRAALLSNGDPSDMCADCWAEVEEARRIEAPHWQRKWSEDRIAERAEAERRAKKKRRRKGAAIEAQ